MDDSHLNLPSKIHGSSQLSDNPVFVWKSVDMRCKRATRHIEVYTPYLYSCCEPEEYPTTLQYLIVGLLGMACLALTITYFLNK